jgi:PhoPQ-activated pathogenicity-related protein
LWEATNSSARDFRLETIGAAWTSSTLADQGGGVYLAEVPEPPQGWTAFMVEMTCPSAGPYPFKFTTEVSVVPQTLPYAPDPTSVPLHAFPLLLAAAIIALFIRTAIKRFLAESRPRS